MGFNFPNSPTEGTLFQPAGGPSYVYSGGVWRDKASNRALVSDSPPPNPANGDLWWESDSGNLFLWYNDGDSSQWVQINTPSNIANLLSSIVTTVITTNGTYTKPAGLKFLEVECVAGGGSGAGAVAVSSTASSGGGGGSGSYSRSLLKAEDVPATVIMSIGPGGPASAGAGGTGGGTQFGSLLTTNGGGGGLATTANAGPDSRPGGIGGSPGQGQFVSGGAAGGNSFHATAQGVGVGGNGAGSYFGGGGRGGVNGTGFASTGYGGGGGGAGHSGSSTAKNSGAGSDGVIILKEFF